MAAGACHLPNKSVPDVVTLLVCPLPRDLEALSLPLSTTPRHLNSNFWRPLIAAHKCFDDVSRAQL